MLPSEDNVQLSIILEAAQALQELKALKTDAVTLQEVFDATQRKISETAQKMGVSFSTMEKAFKDTIRLSMELNAQLAAMGEKQAAGMIQKFPFLGTIAAAESPFAAPLEATGWAEVNAIQKEILRNQANERKMASETAKEINKQAKAEAEKAKRRQEALKLAQQELAAVEKEGAALSKQLNLYGQVSRTASETARYLQAFMGTQQGQSILTRFFGDYQQATSIASQVQIVKKAITDLSTATGASFAQSGRAIREQFSNIPRLASQTTEAVRELDRAFGNMGGRAVKSLDAVRIALGAIVAMIVFRVIQAFQDMFTSAIEGAQKLEMSLYRLVNVERILSEEGIQISPKGLAEGIAEIRKLIPTLSELDVTQLIGSVSILTKDLKLSEQQILDLAKAIAILNIRSTENEDVIQTASKVITAMITNQSRGVGALGESFSRVRIEAKAVEMGFLKAGESMSKLTDEQKAQVKLAIILESTSKELDSINEYLETQTAKVDVARAGWEDFTAELGKMFAPAVNLGAEKLAKFLEGLLGFLKSIEPVIQKNTALVLTFTYALVRMTHFRIPTFQELRQFYEEAQASVDNAYASFNRLEEAADTATSAVETTGEAIADLETDKFRQEIEDILESARQALEDLEKRLGEKREDINLEYIRKREDAERDLARRIEDINRDALRAEQEAIEDFHQQQVQAEEDYQLKLWELRMRYLMDLEDALHARDARQVIRLQKQYLLDQEMLRRRKEQEDQARQDDLEATLEDIEIKRQQRIEDARLEYEQKLQDQRIAKQRELDDLNVWYAREQEDLQRATQRKLQTLIDGWIQEQKITQENAAEVYNILYSYFGPGGLTDQLYQYMMQSLLQASSIPIGYVSNYGQVGGGVGGGSNTHVTPGTVGTHNTGRRLGRGRAEGGTLFANKPTTVTFGEAGAELATFTPLTRMGRDAGRLMSLDGVGGMNGRIVVEMFLSPDLEARVVEASMNGVADVVAKINRTKI